MKPRFFKTAADFRMWLQDHHATASELWIGFHRKSSGREGLTYHEALDEALCYGWIDGRVQRIDAGRYQQRFTPRKRGSIWSNVNVNHVKRLSAAGEMRPSGIAAFDARDRRKTGIYSFERKRPAVLPPEFERAFRSHASAWKFFTAQAPWYQRTVTHKIVSAKRPETRARGLDRAIAASAEGRRLSAFDRTTDRGRK